MIGNYWNSAYRNLMKRKGFSFIQCFRIGSRHGICLADIDLCHF